MNNTCITIDVSQGKGEIQGFTGFKKPIFKPRSFIFNQKGFQIIDSLVKEIELKYNEAPLIILEYTGIYHNCFIEYLKNKSFDYHLVAPLRAAKVRKEDIRSAKTDKRDCLSLSKLYYENKLGKFNEPSHAEEELRKLNRFYETCLKKQQEIKVNFREHLALIYPNYKCTKAHPDSAFINVYSSESLGFLKEFPHPSLFKGLTLEQFTIKMQKYVKKQHKLSLATIYNRLTNYVNSLVSGCLETSVSVDSFKEFIFLLDHYEETLNETLQKMVNLAKNNYLYDLLVTIPGIKENLATRFIAEIGNINNFNSYKAIIAFAGTDPIIFQSGDNNGLHLKISKKGNKHLRTILYLMVNQIAKHPSKETSIQLFYKKKVQQGLKKLAASIACCNKLIRTIYYMNKTGSAFNIGH